MKILNNFQTMGDLVKVNRTHTKHMGLNIGDTGKSDMVSSFAETLNKAVAKVNDKQIHSDSLTQQMITNPNKVNVHTVMIAAQEAQLSLNFLKQVRDKVVRAYQDIMNMR